MLINIKQKISLIIIFSVLLTGISITLGYRYFSIQQTTLENQRRFEIGRQAINDRLTETIIALKVDFSRFQNNEKLNSNVVNIINGGYLEFHMFPSINNLAENLKVKNFGFYYKEKKQDQAMLHLYHSEKLLGNIIVENGQHRLYRKNHFGSEFVDNFALFPEKLPHILTNKITYNEQQLSYQLWQPYYSLSTLKNQQNPVAIGFFNFQKVIDLDLEKLATEIGVEFVIYNALGKAMKNQIDSNNLKPPFPLRKTIITTVNKNGFLFDAMLSPLQVDSNTIGYLSINISSQETAAKLNHSMWIIALISLIVVIIILTVAQGFINKITAPVLELANASLALSTGNLDKDIIVHSKDELGVLANNFNSMRASIQSQLRDLKKEIIERKAAQESVKIFTQAVEQSPVSVIITDPEGNIEYVNSSFEKITGYALDESMGKQVNELGTGIHLGQRREELYEELRAGKTWQHEFQSKKKNGDLYWERVHVGPVFDHQQNIIHYLSVREDITLRKQHEEHIYHQAHFDPLTKLANRFLALDRLEKLIDDAERLNKLVAIVFLDLDGFKKINDTLGHEVGDRLLVKAANRLKNVVRKPDTVARLGGDEFVILLGGLSAVSNVGSIIEKILNTLQRVFVIDGRQLILTASAGISIYPTDGDNTSELLRNADSAMYYSKENGKNKFSFFERSMTDKIKRQLIIEEQLRGALDRHELTVFYQSQVDMKTGEIIGAEALLRWDNHLLGSVSPVEFIPVAEQTGVIIQIGQFVLNEALQMVARWHNEFSQKFRIAVNLSPRQFHEPDLVSQVSQALKTHGVSAASLELEITEGVLLSGHDIIESALVKLSELGICIAMDDFGTGYSSLSYLRKYPFNVLKIDRSFVNDICHDPADKELIRATITMSHGLGLKVVAEGVETKEQLEALKTLHCDFAQGYLFSKPMPEKELIQLAKKHQSNLHLA